MADPISRRQLFRLRPSTLLRMASEKHRENKPAPVYFRPPGALEEADFLKSCERCGLCAEACKHEAIIKLGPETGRHEKTPHIIALESPCHWCQDFACITACPSGALTQSADCAPASIGKAVVDMSSCLISQGTLCDECRSVCPSEIRAIRIFDRQVHINADTCTGCGLCAYYCENAGNAIRIQKS